jgi:dTDP-4-amino-4,6-dideoxygalactose transaminase
MLGTGKSAFEPIFEFERALAAYTGAPYAIMTDCCTHAIELCLMYDDVDFCEFTAYTYLSVAHTMRKLNIEYNLIDQPWTGEYNFLGTRIWDSARRLQPGMYRPGQLQCLSFGYSKPLSIGRGGAILTDDVEVWDILSQQRSDGRDLSVVPWQAQQCFQRGYHYRPTIEEAQRAHALLHSVDIVQIAEYPDLREVEFI